jgi:hypothetical protein
MDHHLCVLLYSKYSPKSKQLISTLDSLPVNLNAVVGLTPICIDHEGTRERILKSQNIKISELPCVLIVYRTGGIEQYEGADAFLWVDNTVKRFLPPPPPQPQIIIPPVHVPQQPTASRRPRQQPVTPVEDLEEEEEEYPPEPPRPKVRKPKAKPPPRAPKQKKQPVYQQPLEDLDAEEEDEEPQHQNIPRPPVPVRSGPGGFEITDDFGTEQEIRPQRPSSRVKQNTGPAQGGDLMAAAMAMQKDRDSFDQTRRPAGAPPNYRA